MSTSAAEATVRIVNPILTATRETFQTMLNVDIRRTFLRPKEPNEPLLAISAVIGVTGSVTGSVCLSFSEQAAIGATRGMLGTDYPWDDPMVRDTVGEFANTIAGAAKMKLVHDPIEIGLPTVVYGVDHRVEFTPKSRPLAAGFDSKPGPFIVAFGFVHPH